MSTEVRGQIILNGYLNFKKKINNMIFPWLSQWIFISVYFPSESIWCDRIMTCNKEWVLLMHHSWHMGKIFYICREVFFDRHPKSKSKSVLVYRNMSFLYHNTCNNKASTSDILIWFSSDRKVFSLTSFLKNHNQIQM